MDKQRLIDANALQKEFEWLESVVCSCRKDDVADSLQRIKNAQTIDLEALPIVQKLRKEMARVTSERDAAVSDLKKWKICATCKNYVPKSKTSNCKVRDKKLLDGNWAGCAKWEWCGAKEG